MTADRPTRVPVRRSKISAALLHSLRVLMLSGIVALVHFEHQRFLGERAEGANPGVRLADVRSFFPAAVHVETSNDGVTRVLSGQNALLGFALKTSPHCDEVIGFSGPTDVLLALDLDRRLVGLKILSSGDTPEHVARVKGDAAFFARFAGMSADELAAMPRVDGVSGATLTSLAVAESLRMRLGGEQFAGSLKFPDPPDLARVKELFPAAESITQVQGGSPLWRVKEGSETGLGHVLRTAPAADNIIGYQGPTDTLIALNNSGRVTRIWVNRSYENEPYYEYLNDDWSFPLLFEGFTLDELAAYDLQAAGIEGVSGATMTSQAVVRGVVAAAKQYQTDLARRPPQRDPRRALAWRSRDLGTAAVVLCGLVIALTHWRSRKWVRVPYQLVVIGYLGLVNGDLLSQAMFVGWAQSGVPWQSTFGLCLLAVAALAVPIATGRNVYCTHICPHGAAQQLLRNRLPLQWHVPARLGRVLKAVPGLLLVWCLLVGLLHVPFSLVGIEPFDAYVIGIAGGATIAVALVGLVASLFVPMAYCRYGCPTGALLNYLRRHGRSGDWSHRDTLAIVCLALAIIVASAR